MSSNASAPIPSPRANEALFTPRFWLACGMHFSGGMALSLYILFPLFIRQLGGSEFSIGLYAGVTGAAAVAARLPVGHFLDTQGRRRVLAVAGLLHVFAWLGFLTVDALGPRLLFLVATYGVASGSLFASYFTYASDIVPVSRRSEGIAMFGIWGMLPNGLGPWLGEILIGHGGFALHFIVAAIFALVSLCLSQLLPETALPVPAQHRGGHPNGDGVPWRELLFLLSTTFMFGAAVNSIYTFFAPFAHAHGRGSVGSFFMSYALTAVAVRVLTGRLPDRLGLRRVLIPSLFLYAAGTLLLPHVEHSLALVVVGMMCGAGHGYAFPILNVLTVQQVTARQRGRAVSWFTAMFDLGNTLANPLLGALAEWAGYGVMFSASGTGILLAAANVWRRPQPERG
jgi:MFS family permease